MVELEASYGRWLETTDDLPRLFINAEPGSILVWRQREYCRSWSNQVEVALKGDHYNQEDSPNEIVQTVAQWLAAIQ